MNKMQKNIFAFAVLASAGQLLAEGCTTTTYYSARNQGTNAVREMVGWQDLINQCDKDCFYGAFAIVGEYSQTFRSNRITECLFGTLDCGSSCNTNANCCDDNSFITISGSCVADRGANDWLADYFGLPTDFQSTISFAPRIRNFVADIEFYVGLDEWTQGLYFRLNLPITHTRWNLNPCEAVTAAGTNDYPAGYFAAGLVERSSLLNNATEFFSGIAPDLSEQDPSIVFQPLACAKWATDCCNSDSITRLADVEAVLGYNFVCCENGTFGLNLRSAAPTGNRPEGEFLFEPIVGNGHHWTLGGGLNARARLWSSCEDDSHFSVYLDANIVHLFKTCQTRSFDLCVPGSNSRYMLAQRLEEATTLFGSTTAGITVPASGTASERQFANEFAPVANLTCSNVDVKVSVEGDVALKFAYETDCGFSWDLGYEFWGKACESICPNSCCNNIVIEDWALKGDAYVYGFDAISAATAVPLGATESLATITGGTNRTIGATPCADANLTNPRIDNAQFAFISGAILRNDDTVGDLQTRTSIQPLSIGAINYSSNRGISNKVFTHLNYTWKDNEDWQPFLGLGASAEFGQSCSDCNSCDTDCNTSCATDCSTSCSPCDSTGSCTSCALSQWAVWVKGGVSFN